MKKIILLIISFLIFGFSFASLNNGFNATYKSQNPEDTTKVNVFELQKIKLYPNPASDFLNIDYNILFIKEAKLKIYNSIGAVVYSRNLEENQDLVKVPVSDYENGLYFCSLEIDGKLLNTRKFLINHH